MLKPEDLRQFTGTEHWYRHPFNRKCLYTDGVKYFAEEAGAYWFLDILATELCPPVLKIPFVAVKMVVADSKAQITADDGNGYVFWARDIAFTDCPPGEWQFWIEDGVILVPSEH